MKYAAVSALAVMCTAGTAHAGAWPQEPHNTQTILSYEPAAATSGWDIDGRQVALGTWTEQSTSLYIDHGLTKHLSLTAKVTYKSYRTDFEHFFGLSSVEVGGRWTVRRTNRSVFAVGATAETGGKGRRSDFDVAQRQGTDIDLRAYYGRNLTLLRNDAFVDLQASRHLRANEADQWRFDATLGMKPSPKWMVMGQVFAGQTDRRAWGRAQWINTEISVVRRFGTASVQLGWRRTVYGRSVPQVNALVLGLWKDF